jgi:hypothetical protein
MARKHTRAFIRSCCVEFIIKLFSPHHLVHHRAYFAAAAVRICQAMPCHAMSHGKEAWSCCSEVRCAGCQDRTKHRTVDSGQWTQDGQNGGHYYSPFVAHLDRLASVRALRGLALPCHATKALQPLADSDCLIASPAVRAAAFLSQPTTNLQGPPGNQPHGRAK